MGGSDDEEDDDEEAFDDGDPPLLRFCISSRVDDDGRCREDDDSTIPITFVIVIIGCPISVDIGSIFGGWWILIILRLLVAEG